MKMPSERRRILRAGAGENAERGLANFAAEFLRKLKISLLAPGFKSRFPVVVAVGRLWFRQSVACGCGSRSPVVVADERLGLWQSLACGFGRKTNGVFRLAGNRKSLFILVMNHHTAV